MPKVIGIFDSFEDLDLIPIEDIAKWLKPPPPATELENYIANRIFYSQAAAVTKKELGFDLAILREALKRNISFYSIKEKKMIIPEVFLERIPELKEVVWAFVDAYHPKDVVPIFLAGEDRDEMLGTVITPTFSGQSDLEISIEEKTYQIKYGTLMVIPWQASHCHLSFKSKQAKVLGKNDLVLEAFGGKLGIMIDARGQS